MGLYTKLAEGFDEVDVIIAGGGTAACIVAGRLAEADPSLSILVIEGGPNNRGIANIETPVFYNDHQLPTSKVTLFYQANKSEHLNGRGPVVSAGGTLGGGSSINFMLYARAQRSDFDSWNTPGWSANELIPYLKKIETYHGGDHNPAVHGTEGPINVSSGTYRAVDTESDFIQAAAKVGWPEIDDLQSLDANNGIQRWLRYVSPDGKRQDAASRYLHPKLEDGKHPNLHVLVESKVVRVLLDDDKRAIGVECTPNPAFLVATNATQPQKMTVKARKLVVVSCGALGTPSVLERSGVGDPKILEKAQVPLQVAVPGVGANYEDHHLLIYPYKTNLKPDQTIDRVLRNPDKRQDLFDAKDPMLGWNGIDISSKLRPTDADVAALGEHFQGSWDRNFKDRLDRPLMLTALINCFLGDPSSVPEGQYASIANYTAYPYSRGHLHITGPNIDDPLDFDAGFLNDENEIDLKKQVWAYKRSREIMRRTAMYVGELPEGHPAWPEGSKASSVEVEKQANNSMEEIKDIEYSAEDDKAIEQSVREKVETTWHSIATCRMAPKDQLGVVDERLNVWGVKGLKLADLSIAPQNVGANTNNTAMVIGEKAAALIIEELGLKS